ncbi:head-tail connector protein [Devosia rhodophyticola]|uniref:Head-tail connector protein n=1 Tax=Devosia rhodophyticola TaxID=3026423 RepID=A0ABY7YZ11_9HYPH|nr:head-tail connector protein [Devosia rhodophyticola]WDR06402.1 head-tail connector protein [Devosia rhodophyticola]
MTSYLLAGPAGEPISLAQAKAFLRVDDEAEDGLITTLITAARLHIEGVTGKALMAQTWRVGLDCWPADRVVKLPVAPLISITAITAYDSDGEPHTIAAAQFFAEPNRLLLPIMVVGMPTLRERGGIEIDYVAGFGSDAEDVPVDLTQAMLSLVGYWFEHRDAVIVAGSGAVVPTGFDRLIAPHKRVRL